MVRPLRETILPEDDDLLPPDKWVWIEGTVFLLKHNTAKAELMDACRPMLTDLGFTVMEQDGDEKDKSPKRRTWTLHRVTINNAISILCRHPQGISLYEFAQKLYIEKEWTDYEMEFIKRKASVMIHKLHKLHLLDKRRSLKHGLLYFPTTSAFGTNKMPSVDPSIIQDAFNAYKEKYPDGPKIHPFHIRTMLETALPIHARAASEKEAT